MRKAKLRRRHPGCQSFIVQFLSWNVHIRFTVPFNESRKQSSKVKKWYSGPSREKQDDHYDEKIITWWWWWLLYRNTLLYFQYFNTQVAPENVSCQPEACNYPHWYVLDDEHGTHSQIIYCTNILSHTYNVCHSRLGKVFKEKRASGPQSVHLCV